MSDSAVGLAMPLRGPKAHAGASLAMANCTRGGIPYSIGLASTSILTFTFNTLWAGMLNKRKTDGITHFAMIHDDVVPMCGWLDVLMEELLKYDADVVSAVIPIKDKRGLTSTALDVTGDEWMPKRLTMTEIYCDFPETFTHEKICLNTGLWLSRLDKPWCEQVWFEQHDRLVKSSEGEFVAQTASEDWNFSRRLRKLGCKLYATRRVPLEHESSDYPNTHPWGTWAVDQEGIGAAPMAGQLNPVGRATSEAA